MHVACRPMQLHARQAPGGLPCIVIQAALCALPASCAAACLRGSCMHVPIKLNIQAFRAMQDSNEFLEVSSIRTVHGGACLYGVSYAAIRSVASGGKVCLVALDVQGAAVLHKDSRIDAAFFYVAPPDFSVMTQRLQARLRERPSTIQKRLTWAQQQVRLWCFWSSNNRPRWPTPCSE